MLYLTIKCCLRSGPFRVSAHMLGCAHVCARLCVRICVRMLACAHVCARSCVCAYVCICLRVRMCVRVLLCTSAHIVKLWPETPKYGVAYGTFACTLAASYSHATQHSSIMHKSYTTNISPAAACLHAAQPLQASRCASALACVCTRVRMHAGMRAMDQRSWDPSTTQCVCARVCVHA